MPVKGHKAFLFCGLTHGHAIKEGSIVISRNSVVHSGVHQLELLVVVTIVTWL